MRSLCLMIWYDMIWEGPSRGLLRNYEPSDGPFWSTRKYPQWGHNWQYLLQIAVWHSALWRGHQLAGNGDNNTPVPSHGQPRHVEHLAGCDWAGRVAGDVSPFAWLLFVECLLGATTNLSRVVSRSSVRSPLYCFSQQSAGQTETWGQTWQLPVWSLVTWAPTSSLHLALLKTTYMYTCIHVFAYILHPASLLTERLATFYLLYYALKAKLKPYEWCIYLLLFSDDFCKKIPPQI